MMKNINKLFFLITMTLMLSIPTTMFVIPAGAQAGVQIKTYMLLSVQPSPVGVGQTVYVNAFMSVPPITASGPYGDMYTDITVKLTKPDGTTTTLGPFMSDATGGTWAQYTVDQIGEYTFQAFYPGQILTGNNTRVPGPGGNLNMVGSQMLPSESEIVKLVVQKDPVQPNYKSPPLPTEYWSRPVYSLNFEWAQLGGSWFGLRAAAFANTGVYDATGNFNPYSKAPNSAHIIWTKPTQFGGLVGQPINADQESQYTSTSILINHFEPIIINGIIFYTEFASITAGVAFTGDYQYLTAPPTGWVAVDIRTGETLWKRSAGITGTENLRMGQILRFHTIQEYGSVAFLWSGPSNGVFRIYDPMTGQHLTNITGAVNMQYLMDLDATTQGTLLGWGTSGNNLYMWNSTKLMFDPVAFPTRLAELQRTMRPYGTVNYTAGREWSVPRTFQINGVSTGALGIGATTPKVILLRSSPTKYSGALAGYQITAGIEAKTGRLLWGPFNQTIPGAEGADMSLLCANDGVYVLHNKHTNEAYGYSLEDGQHLWGPVQLGGNAWSHIQRAGIIAYGRVYIIDYGGYVNALSLRTGVIEWTFHRGSAGYDTPYGINNLWYNFAVADEKLILTEGAMYNPPLHPAKTLAVNTTSGELVWSLLSYAGRIPPAIADSHLVLWNSFDCQIYTLGKGQTETSVVASPKVAVQGSSVIIEGTVMDESPGTKDSNRQARFPKGVPAVSEDSMSSWMEYVYMQQIKPTNVSGVPVKIFVTGPDDNTEHIITVTSNADGLFGYQWRPIQEGLYTIKAVFDGSESYWSSTASTMIAVDSAAIVPVQPTATPTQPSEPTITPNPTSTITISPTPAPQPQAGIPTETLLIIATAVVIIAVVAAIAVLLRKRV